MSTHSSILAWEIPWVEEPVRLQSTGSQRVGGGCVCVCVFDSKVSEIIVAFRIE